MSRPVNDIPNPTLRTLTHELVLVVKSPAFAFGETIPTQFTCDGENTSPALTIRNIPPEAKSLALIFSDRTLESKPFAHWLVWNIPPSFGEIAEGSVPGIQGTNDLGNKRYDGPCFTGTVHQYRVTVYALDTILNLGPGANQKVFFAALEGHILAASELVAAYPQASDSFRTASRYYRY
jgi:Raf kinase inhibitor-like YbhB/YbcL family protein